jgi:diguanylate cyclase (GGDEF)-like protein
MSLQDSRLPPSGRNSSQHDIANLPELQAALLELKGTVERQSGDLSKAEHHRVALQRRVEELEEANGNLVVAKLQMAHLANHDLLTGLPNRVQLQERLSYAMALAESNRKKLAVVFLDLDRFKAINDALSHQVGDQLLITVAQRLVGCVRSSDIVCRQGGDEFVILLSELEHTEDAVRLVKKILDIMAEPIEVSGNPLQMTTSIGISVYPDDTVSPEALIKHADTAMYQAKEQGRNQFKLFTPDMNEKAVARQLMENGLRRAIVSNEFEIHYQPKVNLQSGELVGVEALIRWHYPHRGLLSPSIFMHTAEETGLIVQLSQWMLEQCCRQASQWHDDGYDFGRISVNVSAQDFHHTGFAERIKAILNATGLHPKLFEIEITEGVLMKDAAMAVNLLHELRHLGVCISIDDFGTGYSSLSYLKQLPINVLKIDRSFLDGIDSNCDDAVILGAIINLGNSLNLDVVAEGIETQGQVNFLLEHDCHLGQGYFYSPPVTADAVVSFYRPAAYS